MRKLRGTDDPPLPYISRGENETGPFVTRSCVDFTAANYLAPRVVWSQWTLAFARERNYKKDKNFSKSFLQFFVGANTVVLGAQTTGDR